MKFASVEEIKDLHHHKRIEDEGKVSWVKFVGIEDIVVVNVSIDVVESSTADCTSNHTVVPLVLRITGENSSVEGVSVFRNELLS